jgi:CheY-like chemotaxis protein
VYAVGVSRPRILVVDDSETVLRIVEAALCSDYDVVTALDGEEGLEKARQLAPDLIVTDSLMPRLDGFGLLRTLQAYPATRSIPAIVLTSEESEERRPAPGDVQPCAIITKSIDPAPLLDAIRTALASRIVL